MHTQSQSALLSIIAGDSPLLKILQGTAVIQMFSSLFGPQLAVDLYRK